jgi:hypothetical protein
LYISDKQLLLNNSFSHKPHHLNTRYVSNFFSRKNTKCNFLWHEKFNRKGKAHETKLCDTMIFLSNYLLIFQNMVILFGLKFRWFFPMYFTWNITLHLFTISCGDMRRCWEIFIFFYFNQQFKKQEFYRIVKFPIFILYFYLNTNGYVIIQ